MFKLDITNIETNETISKEFENRYLVSKITHFIQKVIIEKGATSKSGYLTHSPRHIELITNDEIFNIIKKGLENEKE